MPTSRFLSNLIAMLWLALNSNIFVICVLAILSWALAFLLGYVAWIVISEMVRVLESVLRVLLRLS